MKQWTDFKSQLFVFQGPPSGGAAREPRRRDGGSDDKRGAHTFHNGLRTIKS